MIIVKVGGGAAINVNGVAEDLAGLDGPAVVVLGANAVRDGLAEQLGTPRQTLTSVSGYTSVFSDAAALDAIAMAYAGLRATRFVERCQMPLLVEAECGVERPAGDEISSGAAGEAGVEAGVVLGGRGRGEGHLDTGMGRMGIPHHRAMPVLSDAAGRDIDISGTFMGGLAVGAFIGWAFSFISERFLNFTAEGDPAPGVVMRPCTRYCSPS